MAEDVGLPYAEDRAQSPGVHEQDLPGAGSHDELLAQQFGLLLICQHRDLCTSQGESRVEAGGILIRLQSLGQGSSFSAVIWAGVTARKCRWSSVATSLALSRSATASTDACATPRGKPMYWRISSAMRMRSPAGISIWLRSPAASASTKLTSASAPTYFPTR